LFNYFIDNLIAELEEKIRTWETTQGASIDVLYFTVTLRTKSDSKEKHYEIRTLNLKFKIVCVDSIYIIIAPTHFKMVRATTHFYFTPNKVSVNEINGKTAYKSLNLRLSKKKLLFWVLTLCAPFDLGNYCVNYWKKTLVEYFLLRICL
jgi:hypothetical protein